MNGGWGITYEIALRWMPLDLTGDKSTLFQVMAWCRQATRHYLSQCWPRSLSPYSVTRPQWVKWKVAVWRNIVHLFIHLPFVVNIVSITQSPVLLQRYDTLAIISANGSAAFNGTLPVAKITYTGRQPPAQQKNAQTYFVWRCLLRLICR